MRLIAFLLLLGTAACGVDLEVPGDAHIDCTADGQCPAPLVCQTSAGRCVNAGHEDHDPPQLLSANAADTFHVVLELDEDADPASVQAAVFEVAGLTVGAGVIDASLRRVTVETGAQEPGLDYTITTRGLTDLFSNAMADSALPFTGFGAFPDRNPPVILGPLASDIIVNGLAVLAWTQPSLAHTYTVDVATDAAYTQPIAGSPLTVSEATRTTLLLKDLSAVRYYWRIRADTTTANAYSESTFDIVDGHVIYVSCPASVATCSDAGLAGNAAAPLQTISGAVALAAFIGAIEIRVAARGGEARYQSNVVLSGQMSLNGGYDATFATRDVAAYPTILDGGTASTIVAVGAHANILIDGITIRAPSANGIDIVGGFAPDQVTISHCDIDSGRSGILVRNGDVGVPKVVTVSFSHLVRSFGDSLDAAVKVDEASASLHDNTIEGMTPLVRAVRTSWVELTDNVLLATSSRDASGITLDITEASIGMHRNTVIGPSVRGDGGDFQTSQAINVSSSTPDFCQIVDNVFVSGSASIHSNNTIRCSAVPTVIANNIFVSGVSGESVPLVAGTPVRVGHDDIYVDNIFAGQGGTCFDVQGFEDLRNNAFAGCSTLVVARGDTTAILTTIAEVNDPSQYPQPSPPVTSGNLAFATVAELALVNPPSDFHPTASTPVSVLNGGLDTSDTNGFKCGIAANHTCGAVTNDRDKVNRSCPDGGHCFTIGPYERDVP